MSWTAVTFATPEFAAVAVRWEEMIRRHGGRPVVVLRDSTGDWACNCGLKPAAILEAMQGVAEGEVVVYLDADASIDGAPQIPAGEWEVGLVDNPNPTHKNRITAACLFLRQGAGAREFLLDWAHRCAERPGIDHPKLTRTIENAAARMVKATGWIAWAANGLSEEKPGFPSVPLVAAEPIYVGYYTPGDYEKDWVVLRESLEALGLAHDFRRWDEGGSWLEVTGAKPRVIAEALELHAGRPVVYLDVDAIVVERPELFGRLCGAIGAVRFPGGELLSGTLYFGPGAAAREIVAEWVAEAAAHPEVWDQRCLRAVMRRRNWEGFEELPAGYAWMVGLTQTRCPGVAPVILHTRGSLRHHPDHP